MHLLMDNCIYQVTPSVSLGNATTTSHTVSLIPSAPPPPPTTKGCPSFLMLTEVPPYSHVDKVNLHADQFIFLGDQLEPFHHQVIFLLRSHWTTQAQLPVTLRMHGMHTATKEHKHSSLLLYGCAVQPTICCRTAQLSLVSPALYS